MQKLIASILCIFIITGSACAKDTSSNFKQGVLQYKSGNYIGSMETMQSIVKNDPGDAVAHYYLAISYVKLGKKNDAAKEYNNVISLNPASKLVDYAKQGLGYLGTQQQQSNPQQHGGVPQPEQPVEPGGAPQPGQPGEPWMPGGSPQPRQPGEPIQPDRAPQPPNIPNLPQMNIPGTKAVKDYMSDKVRETMKEKELNKVINDANNNNGQVDPNILKRFDDFSNKKSENKTPSKEQVAQAMQVLSAAGMSQNYNPEAMQMNMLMSSFGGQNAYGMNSGYSSNPMTSIMPLIMMGQNNNQKMDPQLMETMMTTMMMPGMMQLGNNNNENNY
ncbi:MAG: tetratricopeptide repeat protein [Candidatus Gastranaerophilales bacterium]|nr:tetratricopeptide repeat protein [Candidatus Gastranaerophilales bacterium]